MKRQINIPQCPKCKSNNIRFDRDYDGDEIRYYDISKLGEIDEDLNEKSIEEIPWEAVCVDCGYTKKFTRKTRSGEIQTIESQIAGLSP